MTLKIQIFIYSRRLFIILVSLTITWFSGKMLISPRCICGLMPNLIKKSCRISKQQWRAVCTQSLTQKGRKKIYLQQTTTTVSSVLGWAKGLLNFFIEIVLLELGLMKIVTVLKKTSSEVWKCDFSFNFAHW